MEKKIEDYLHLYLGCEIRLWSLNYDGQTFKLDATILQLLSMPDAKIKPLLRPLSSMTEEECQECGNLVYDFSDEPELNNHTYKDFATLITSEQFVWLLSRHFDLFELIESGLAIDKTKH